MTKSLDDFRQAGELPSPGAVALRLNELASREDVSAAEFARAVQVDPALTGRLLRLANSAAFGGRAVAAVADAVVRLGFRGVRQLAMGFSLLERSRAGACAGFDYPGFWSRSLGTAVAAERLAREVRVAPAEDCFTLGLLHDVGSLALATLYPKEYARLLGTTAADEPARLEAERAAFEIDHRALASLLLRDWRIPEPFVRALELRGALPAGVPTRERRLAEFADAAATLGRWLAGPAGVPAPTGPARQVGIPDPEYAAAIADIVRDWQEWSRELGLPSRPHAAGPEAVDGGPAAAGVAATREVPATVPSPGSASAPVPTVAPAPVEQPAEPLRALVVEDSDSQRLTLERLIASFGFEVRSARNGAEALQVLATARIDVVLSDLVMPELDGIGLCRAIRAARESAHVYVVLLTAHSDHARLVEAFDAGVDDFLGKPLNVRELQARLRAARRIVELQRRLEADARALREANGRLEQANQQLQSTARTDSLTGLPNRRYVLETLKQQWAAAERVSAPFALIFVDVDHFKQVNDRHGHDAGDIVLERVGRVLRQGVRAMDTVGRFGGEEFVVVCPDADADAVRSIAERIRAKLANVEYAIGGDAPWHVTASLGVAWRSRVRAGDRWDELLREADAALYAAKHEGRNRVRMHAA